MGEGVGVDRCRWDEREGEVNVGGSELWANKSYWSFCISMAIFEILFPLFLIHSRSVYRKHAQHTSVSKLRCHS